jgi:hypothetical protein
VKAYFHISCGFAKTIVLTNTFFRLLILLTVLKFLFIRSCQPYIGFIRSWIYEAEISDPYKEFMVEYADNLSPYPHYKGGIPIDFVLASIQVTSFIQKKKKY